MRFFIRRPGLIDEILHQNNNGGSKSLLSDGHWYVSKCLPQYGISGFLERCWHAWLVLTDRARAYEHMEDRRPQ